MKGAKTKKLIVLLRFSLNKKKKIKYMKFQSCFYKWQKHTFLILKVYLNSSISLLLFWLISQIEIRVNKKFCFVFGLVDSVHDGRENVCWVSKLNTFLYLSKKLKHFSKIIHSTFYKTRIFLAALITGIGLQKRVINMSPSDKAWDNK